MLMASRTLTTRATAASMPSLFAIVPFRLRDSHHTSSNACHDQEPGSLEPPLGTSNCL